MGGQRERKVEVERGNQVDVSAHVGRKLQRLYRDTVTLDTYRRYTLCVGQRERKVEEEKGETGRYFCPCWQGTAEAVQGHPHHLLEVHFVVSQKERKLEEERGRQVDVSAHVGTELQRLYKDTLTTYRRYILW